MIISNLVDVDRYPWICPVDGGLTVTTRLGEVHVPRGMLSDGASGPVLRWRGRRLDLIPDLDPRAWFPHDRLFASPYVMIRGARYRVGFFRSNAIYRLLLARYGHPVRGAVRGYALHVIGWPAWLAARRAERVACPADWHTVPPDLILPDHRRWSLPSWRTADAVWLG